MRPVTRGNNPIGSDFDEYRDAFPYLCSRLGVLTRRLAPAFNLDVSAYSGYLSVTSDRIRRLLEYGVEDVPLSTPTKQSSLFDDMEFLDDVPEEEQASKQKWMFISPEEAGQ